MKFSQKLEEVGIPAMASPDMTAEAFVKDLKFTSKQKAENTKAAAPDVTQTQLTV